MIEKKINKLKLIPRKIYFIAIFAVISSFVTVVAEYGFSLMLQVYANLLGFLDLETVTPFLRGLVENVYLAFGLLIAAIFLRGVSLFIQSYVNIAFSETFIYETRKSLLDDLFKPDSRWHYDLGTTSNIMAEIIPKGSHYVTALARFIVLMIQVVGIGVFCLISLPREFLISLLVFALLAPVIVFLNKKSRGYGYKMLERSRGMNIQLMKSIKNFIFIKILGMEKIERDKTVDLAHDYYSHFMRNTRYYALANAFPITFGTAIVIVLFYIFNIGGASKASLLTMFYLLLRFIQNLSQAVAVTNGINMYHANFQSVIEILQRNRECGIEEDRQISASSKKSSLIDSPDKLSLYVSDLSFAYNVAHNERVVFNKVSFDLKYGELFVVKGPSGSGKSTLLMNLIGVLEPSNGKVKWSGVDLADIDNSDFKRKVGYMGPEPYIINGTVHENLCYGLHDQPTKEQLIEACKLSEAYDFLVAMPKGFETVLTEQGEGLSMGQKQRIGLARALLRKPKILVLDEITANLDRNTEAAVIDNIKQLSSKMMIFIATHSSAFDEIADVVLEFGNDSTWAITKRDSVYV